jgi:hypothetical protein
MLLTHDPHMLLTHACLQASQQRLRRDIILGVRGPELLCAAARVRARERGCRERVDEITRAEEAARGVGDTGGRRGGGEGEDEIREQDAVWRRMDVEGEARTRTRHCTAAEMRAFRERMEILVGLHAARRREGWLLPQSALFDHVLLGTGDGEHRGAYRCRYR